MAAGFALAFTSIGLRLVDMVEWQPPVGRAEATVPTPVASPAEQVMAAGRADIVDRNGVVLATTIRVPGVYADPSLLPDKALAARKLAAVDRRRGPRRTAAALRGLPGASPGLSTGSRPMNRLRSWSSVCPA